MFTTPAVSARECTIVVASTKFAFPVYWFTQRRYNTGFSAAASASAANVHLGQGHKSAGFNQSGHHAPVITTKATRTRESCGVRDVNNRAAMWARR